MCVSLYVKGDQYINVYNSCQTFFHYSQNAKKFQTRDYANLVYIRNYGKRFEDRYTYD